MTTSALQDMKNLIDRELGSTGWTFCPLDEFVGGDHAGFLVTQRGVIPFSTLRLLVEMIPEVLERYAEDIERAKDEAYEEALHDYGHRFE